MSSNMIAKDKAAHVIVCFLMAITLSALVKYLGVEEERAISIGTLLTFVAGIAKEFYDKYYKKTKFDINDIIADMIGIFMAIFAMLII